MPRGGKREGAGRKPKAAPEPPETPKRTTNPVPANTLAVTLLRACTGREQAFILELVAHPELTHREAFQRAGYSGKSDVSIDANASKVLRRDRVQKALTALQTEKLERQAVTAVMTGEEALERLSAYARSDIGLVLGDNNPISKLPLEVRQSIKAVRPTRYGTVIELYDAMKATELMAKAGGKLKDHVEHSGKVTLEDIVAGDAPQDGAAA